MNDESSLPMPTKIAILVIMFVQSVLLYFLFEYDRTFINYSSSLYYSIISVVFSVPLFSVLLIYNLRDKYSWYIIAGYSVIVFLLALYTGNQCATGNCNDAAAQFIFPHLISLFIILFFAQVWLKNHSNKFSYSDLFNASWDNYLTAKLTAIFVGLFWALLALWVSLFKLIEITFFYDLFYSQEFAFPVTGIVVGLGIVVFRSQINAVDMVRRILRVLIRWLLPVISFIAIIFIVTVPFAGLESLWKTGYATALLLWLVCLVLFFTNAVFQDGKNEAEYSRIVSGLIKAAIFILPAYLVIAAYALGLRVAQHGWSIDRLWVATIIMVLAGFVFSYAYFLIRNHNNWLSYFAKTNRIMAIVVAVACLLITSPIIDFRKITVSDQLSRLKQGEISSKNFDYKYFYFELGKAGYTALLELRDTNKSNQKMVTVIDNTLKMKNRWDILKIKIKTASELSGYLPVYPATQKAPEELLEFIYNNKNLYANCNVSPAKCFLLAVDINADKQKEYMLFKNASYSGYTKVFGYKNHQWTIVGSATNSHYFKSNKFKEAIETGQYQVIEHNWKDLLIDGKRFIFKDN